MALILLILSLLFGNTTYGAGMDEISFKLAWEDPKRIDSRDLEQMRELFIPSFLKTYRLSHTLDNKADDAIEAFLADYFNNTIQPNLQKKPQLFFLSAKWANRWAGFAIFEKIDHETMYIAELALSPDFWRRGLGTQMTYSILEKEPSTRKIVLLTEWVNLGAQKFYESIGFIPSSYTHPGYSPEEFRAYEKMVNEKDLNFTRLEGSQG
jgi:ribosomal protein S18 acetylase RimI-like enzyme